LPPDFQAHATLLQGIALFQDTNTQAAFPRNSGPTVPIIIQSLRRARQLENQPWLCESSVSCVNAFSSTGLSVADPDPLCTGDGPHGLTTPTIANCAEHP